MKAGRSRLPLAVLVAVAAAGAATFLLRPRSGMIEPAAGRRAKRTSAPRSSSGREDFRDMQRLLALAGLGRQRRHPRPARLAPAAAAARARWRDGRVLGGAAAGAGISLLLVVVGLPLAAWRHERARRRRTLDPGWGPWLGDVAKSAGDRGRLRRRRRGGRDRPGAPLPAPLVEPGRRGRRGLRRGHALALAGGDRPALQRLRAASGRAGCARTCSSWRAGRTWTWARSTASTPAAGRPPPTPTWAGSGTPSAWCSTTT